MVKLEQNPDYSARPNVVSWRCRRVTKSAFYIYSYFNLRCRIKASSVRDIHKAAATSSTWNPNISFIQMARHRRSSQYGLGIVNFADSYSLRSHIPLGSSLVGLRLWSDNVKWNSCIRIVRRTRNLSFCMSPSHSAERTYDDIIQYMYISLPSVNI